MLDCAPLTASLSFFAAGKLVHSSRAQREEGTDLAFNCQLSHCVCSEWCVCVFVCVRWKVFSARFVRLDTLIGGKTSYLCAREAICFVSSRKTTHCKRWCSGRNGSEGEQGGGHTFNQANRKHKRGTGQGRMHP